MPGGGKSKAGCTLGGCYFASVVIIFVVALTVSFLGGPGESFADTNTGTWTGSTDTVAELDGAKMPATSGKVGHEQHFGFDTCFASGYSHVTDSYSNPLANAANCGAFGGGKTSDQEQWYFNMRWDTSSNYPGAYKHKKVIITNPVNGKRIVASIEEYGPAAFLETRDGIIAGAPPDVYNYLELANAYTKNPGDKQGYAEFAFAKNQSIPLGPLE